jgi:hypothetical protein
MRIRVVDVLDLLAAGLSREEVLEEVLPSVINALQKGESLVEISDR